MEINEKTWSNTQPLADVEGRVAPKAVVVALNSIIGDADTAASWSQVSYPTASTTVWQCWIVTESAIGHIRVEYQHELYDQEAERQEELTPSNWSAWVRPLADILRLEYGAFYAATGKPTTFEPAIPIKVIFTNGEITIPEGNSIPVEHRAAADKIFSKLRAGLKF